MFRRPAALLLVSASLLGGVLLHAQGLAQPALAAPGSFTVSYTGTNYYQPTDYFNHCMPWTWLGSCYTDTTGGVSPQQGVSNDARFIVNQHLGTFHRVWISLDQLMNWDPTNGYQSYNPTYLGHVDDMLHRFAQYGIKVDLVLLTYSQGANAAHEFHPEALDGQHPTMRANYLRAVGDFMSHLAADPVDLSTLAVVDLENEAYYQLDTYYSDTAHLGTFTNCIGAGGGTDWGCVDNAVIHPWLLDLYATAKAAAPSVLYTVSDNGSLLTTDATDQVHWISMYPADVYDIHMYSNTPSTGTTRWATGLQLPKPWFVGEAGCAPGNVSCTYDGTNAEPVDQWWLENLRTDGARAVLVEDRSTAWTYLNGPNSASLTQTGQMLEQVTLSSGNSTASSVSIPPTSTLQPTNTPTNTPQPTDTPTHTPQATDTPTSTPRPIDTATSTPRPTDTPTSTPAPFTAPTAIPLATVTVAPVPSATTPHSTTPVAVAVPQTIIPGTTTAAFPGFQGFPLPATLPVTVPHAAAFWSNFAAQSPGALNVGGGSGQFTGVVGESRLSVAAGVSPSGSNGLSVLVDGGGSAYAYKQFSTGALHSDVRFKIRLGADFKLGSGQYVVLAQTQSQPGAATSVGKVNLVLNDAHALFVAYVDSSGTQRYIWTSGSLDGNWHSIEIKETAGVSTGFINLLVDGASVGGATAVDTGGGPVSYLGVGAEYTPNDTSTVGHLYLDGVSMQLSD